VSIPAHVYCHEAIEELSSYLDGELTEQRRQAIEHHLHRCPPCEQIASFEVELRRVIADRCQTSVPQDLAARIRAALDGEAGAAR